MTVRDERFEALLGTAAPLVAAVFDALPDAIGVVWPIVDETGALVDFEVGYTNPSSERMMGVRLGDEAGARLREVMPGVVPMGLYDRLLRVAESRQAESAEITLDTMWRDVVHVRGVWVHTVLPFGSGLLSVAFDVSEERRREQELRDFAAVAAHDLREPLVGMRVWRPCSGVAPGSASRSRRWSGFSTTACNALPAWSTASSSTRPRPTTAGAAPRSTAARSCPRSSPRWRRGSNTSTGASRSPRFRRCGQAAPGWSGSFRTSSPTPSSFTTATHRPSPCPRKTARPAGTSRYATTGSDCPGTARS